MTMGITELAEVVRAGLGEDERVALAATFEETHPQGNNWRWGEVGDVPAPAVRDGYLRGNGGLSATVSLVTVETYDAEGHPYPAEALHSASHVYAGVADHIARQAPARVLAEVAAKRQLLDHVLGWPHAVDDTGWCDCDQLVPAGCTCGRDERVLAVLQALAAPYQET